jgi:hypothetical protein
MLSVPKGYPPQSHELSMDSRLRGNDDSGAAE